MKCIVFLTVALAICSVIVIPCSATTKDTNVSKWHFFAEQQYSENNSHVSAVRRKVYLLI